MITSIGLLVSLALNACQYAESFYKDKLSHDLKEKELNYEQANKEAERKHEFEKMKLEENIHRSRHLIPEARKACIEYIGLTEGELALAKKFPVEFSSRQHELEAQVLFYVPEALNTLQGFDSSNLPDTQKMNVKLLTYIFNQDVIPELAKHLQTFQSGRK